MKHIFLFGLISLSIIQQSKATSNEKGGWRGTGGKEMTPSLRDEDIVSKPAKPAKPTSPRPEAKSLPGQEQPSSLTKTDQKTPVQKTGKTKKPKRTKKWFGKKASKKDKMIIGNPELKKIGGISEDVSKMPQHKKEEIIKANREANKANKGANKDTQWRRGNALNKEEYDRNIARKEAAPAKKSPSMIGNLKNKLFGPTKGQPVRAHRR